ncbi:hypothetical protein Scep_025958 [Stephania cephalantha]|uniref:Uncharacterized protein n=1 Tax=Stephania cephalantha TaxID=152367 RepID=A0AAP0EJN1_9MAGN
MLKDLISVYKQNVEVLLEIHHDNLLYQEKWEQNRIEINSSCQNMSILLHEMNISIDNLINKEVFLEPIHCDQEENASVTMLRSVEEDEYFFELVDELEVLLSELNVIITKVHEEEAEMKNEVTLERPYDPYEESKEDQPLVLMNPPLVSCIFVEFKIGMEQKRYLEALCGVDSYVLKGEDYMETYSLEVVDELKTLKEGMFFSLPKATVIPFVRDYSKLVGVT